MSAREILKYANFFLKLSQESVDATPEEIRNEVGKEIEWEALNNIYFVVLNFVKESGSNLFAPFVKESRAIAKKVEDALYEWMTGTMKNPHERRRIMERLDKFYDRLKHIYSVLFEHRDTIHEFDTASIQALNELFELFEKTIQTIGYNLNILHNIEKEVDDKIKASNEIDFRLEEMTGEDLYAL